MTKPGPNGRIDPEEVAAFAEGRFSGRARTDFMARLVEDEDALDLYAELIALADGAEESDSEPDPKAILGAEPSGSEAEGRRIGGFRTETSEATGDSERTESQSADTWLRWAPQALLAAGLGGAAVLALWLSLRPTPTSQLASLPPSRHLVERISTGGEALARLALPETELGHRGPALEADPERRRRGSRLRLGVRSVDIAAAAAEGSLERAAAWLLEMANDARNVPGLTPIADRWLALSTRAAEGEPGLAAEIDAVEAELLRSPDPLIDLGRWAEAMRLAARLGDKIYLCGNIAQEGFERYSTWPTPSVATEAIGNLEQAACAGDAATAAEGLTDLIQRCATGLDCLPETSASFP